MTVADARELIHAAPIDRDIPQRWLDLGCGTGIFTRALAELLPKGSSIVAVDVDVTALQRLPNAHAGVFIEAQQGSAEHLPQQHVHGVLMANLLHFIADQQGLLKRLAACTEHIVLVEYDRALPLPPWVPHPVPRTRAVELFKHAGFARYLPLGERPSSYGPDELYAASFTRTT
ncbi:MAG: class I SAM-dependent methyltransferase [Flavobacteriales bacterium]|nr:class I SAM-dependent methyltransferase [Flavobacteriales bacterium]